MLFDGEHRLGYNTDYRAAMELAAAGCVDVGRIVSDVFSFDELGEAYDTALEGAEGKIIIVAE